MIIIEEITPEVEKKPKKKEPKKKKPEKKKKS
jgi:hypothetical protein